VTVLERPIRMLTLMSALRTALRSRRRQYEIRALLDQREKALQGRDEFLGLLAHELRNPLSAIRNATQILSRISLQNNVAVQQRALIERQIDHLAHRIADVLDAYQIMSGKITLQRQAVDLVDGARRVLKNLDSTARAHQVQLSFVVGAEPLLLEGDRQRLEQVLNHLLANAINNTPSGGRVVLSLAREGDEAVVRVRDTGVGVSADVIQHLGDSLPEETRLPVRPEGGLQLGLMLVRNLVELHGGTTSATSLAPEGGSEFTVRLPLRKPVSTPAPAGAQPPGAGRPSRRVLLLEDNPDGRETLELILRLWGHQVEVAADGNQGVQKALASRPEVALIDIGLPGLDGYQVARKLRASLGRGVVLVAMTGYGQDQDRRRAFEAGFDAHLVKPVEPDVLQEIVSHPEKANQHG
jgi:CheY-like chemotaxis protein/nitrogen-specific signal transduction histidine kinase